MIKYLNIVSFDVPFPADYGGVIDVYHKIRILNSLGVKIILHCFKYGRNESVELEKLCEKVYYYERKKSFSNHISILPFIVKSRISQDLIKNLDSNNYPILFEGLHTCGNVLYLKKKKRKLIYRESNIEHEYYRYLGKNETNLFLKIFYLLESIKLKIFQKRLKNFNLFAVVSGKDKEYLQKIFHDKEIVLIPSFHQYDEVCSINGKGNYILYHGNLSISENYISLFFLIDKIFSKIQQKVVITGKNPINKLVEKCKLYKNIELIPNPNPDTINKLIENAQVICLHTFQNSGLKLKLLNSLYSGRFILVNTSMLYGTSLHKACVICDTEVEYINNIKKYFEINFNDEYKKEREYLLNYYNNIINARILIDKIYE